jgi:Rrf2 family iron-sulfur cluster assembly transcriptional regulator
VSQFEGKGAGEESFVKITRQADYAVRVIVYLSGLAPGSRVPTTTISEAAGIPRPFLTKVVSLLVTAGLVSTRRGMGGGVSLARSPEEVTLLQVVEAIDGPILINECLLRPGACELEPNCGARDVWADIQARLVQSLEAVTMKELAQHEAAKRPRAQIDSL